MKWRWVGGERVYPLGARGFGWRRVCSALARAGKGRLRCSIPVSGAQVVARRRCDLMVRTGGSDDEGGK